MKKRFARISNVQTFMEGFAHLDKRDAPEASLMLVSGEAGFGKSRTASWWAINGGANACFIRIKAAATCHWVLTDLVRELNESAPAHTCENLFAQAVGALLADPRPVVVDEIESALHDIKVIETLRDIADVAEVPVVLVGREYVGAALRRHPQIDTRISSRVQFGPVSRKDIDILARDLCDAPMDQEVLDRIHKASEGRVRNAVKALGNADRAAKTPQSGRAASKIEDAVLFRGLAPRGKELRAV